MELVVEKSLMLLFGRWISGNFRSFFFPPGGSMLFRTIQLGLLLYIFFNWIMDYFKALRILNDWHWIALLRPRHRTEPDKSISVARICSPLVIVLFLVICGCVSVIVIRDKGV